MTSNTDEMTEKVWHTLKIGDAELTYKSYDDYTKEGTEPRPDLTIIYSGLACQNINGILNLDHKGACEVLRLLEEYVRRTRI